MRTARDIPPPLELECLKALWQLGEASVKDVRRILLKERSLAYTTVMTVLDRLARKGGVSRRKVGRSFVYSAVFRRDVLRRVAVKELVDRFFEGSDDALIAYLRNPEPALAASATPALTDAAEPTLRSRTEFDDRLDTALL
jgi:predicted transcriptional regulator